MATYKVIQDIEADDKLIWQLSFRQFVYALIAAVFLYVSYLFIAEGVAFMVLFSLPVALFTGFLAYPFGKDQPTEVWALARLRFLIKPRKRIWAQSGVKELVTITVPKRVEANLTDGLSQTEVKSRLQALADTIDSRGWTIKNMDVYDSPLEKQSSDRLVSTSTLTHGEPEDIAGTEDILDIEDNPIAQKMDQLLISNSNKRRQELIDNLDKMREEETVKNDKTLRQPTASTNNGSSYSASTDDDDSATNSLDEQLLAKDLEYKEKHQNIALNRMRTVRAIKPAPSTPVVPIAPPKATVQNDPDIINLARSNDKNIEVLGREINRARGDLDDSENEVTISLR